MGELLRYVFDGGMVARQQRFVARYDERAPRITCLKYFRSQVLDYGFDLMGMGDKGIARTLPVRRLIQQHTTAYQQDHGDGERRPGHTSEGKAHAVTTAV